MHFLQLAALTASLAFGPAQAIRGFNTGNMAISGSAKQQSDFEAEFTNQKGLEGTDGAFTSARLYTMIQGGTTNTPISAIQAAMDTKTGLLLGMWASGGQEGFNNELAALTSAITNFGPGFASLVQGISVGSEDLYRITPTGIANDAGIGAEPETVISYINAVKSAIKGTILSDVPVGHVDTWTAWANSSNADVVSACDFLGVDAYPYYQTTDANSIENSGSLFYNALDLTRSNAQGKPVWVTETGYPVTGPTENLAVASQQNAQSYWDQVYCTLPSDVNVYWYTQSDADQASGVGSFGVVGETLTTTPRYSLSCKNVNTTSTSSSSSSSTSSSTSSASASVSSGSATSSASGSVSSSGAFSSNTLVTVTATQASSTAAGTGVYPTGPAVSGVDGPTGTGSSTPSTSSIMPAPANGASGAQLSLVMLAVPALLALFA